MDVILFAVIVTVALAILFDEKSLPMEYKLRLSEFLSSVKKGTGPDDGAQK